MAGVLPCRDRADGPRSVDIVAVTREASTTNPGLSELGCTLHFSVVAHLFLLAARIKISPIAILGNEIRRLWNLIL
jgi:hypothetical protein